MLLERFQQLFIRLFKSSRWAFSLNTYPELDLWTFHSSTTLKDWAEGFSAFHFVPMENCSSWTKTVGVVDWVRSIDYQGELLWLTWEMEKVLPRQTKRTDRGLAVGSSMSSPKKHGRMRWICFEIIEDDEDDVDAIFAEDFFSGRDSVVCTMVHVRPAHR